MIIDAMCKCKAPIIRCYIQVMYRTVCMLTPDEDLQPVSKRASIQEHKLITAAAAAGCVS